MPSIEIPPNPEGLIEIRPTTYGGRGYFALSSIPANTLIHVSPSPYTLSIIRDFKKECCARCFHCNVGRNLKWRAERGNVAGFWFCGERCKREWAEEEDVGGLIGEAMECLERGFKRQKRAEPPQTPEEELENPELGASTLDEEMLERVWKDAANASSPKPNQIPDGEVDQEEARLITYALVRLHNSLSPSPLSPGSESSPTWHEFLHLQPNALPHFRSQPYMLPSHLHTFHFLRAVLPKRLKSVLTVENFRAVTARDPGNSFGIWEQGEEGGTGDGESEMLGWAMYPSASYFNHDCDPNTKKVRRGRAMTMVTTRDVAEGEELCISYGHLEDDVRERRRRLEDKFFFRCGLYTVYIYFSSARMSAASSISAIRIPATNGAATAAVIFAHGLGDSGAGWSFIADHYKREKSLQHIKWIFPNAPLRPITLNGGMRMPAWYDLTSLERVEEAEDSVGMLQSVETIHALVKETIESGIPADRIVIGGFSQGSAMALLSGMIHKEKLAGIAGMSGYLPMASKLVDMRHPHNHDTPIFMAHGTADPVVKFQFGKMSMEFLKEKLGMEKIEWREYPGMGHTADLKELADFARWLEKVVPPKN
ncbi:hypothetical protein YB2330_005699 [Saitoella coloradoensis]